MRLHGGGGEPRCPTPGVRDTREVIPLRDDVPTRRAPRVTLALIVANVVVFVYELVLGGADPDGAVLDAFLGAWGLVPREFLRRAADPASGAWLTPFSSMFLHAGVLHVGGNMLYLWIFGNNVEDLLGAARFALFYTACGLTAAVAHVASAPDSFVPTVGASGAVSGVLGGYLLCYPRARVLTLVPLGIVFTTVAIPAAFFLVVWFGLQVASGLTAPADTPGGVAWWAHIGGFVAGLVLVRPMRVRSPLRARSRM